MMVVMEEISHRQAVEHSFGSKVDGAQNCEEEKEGGVASTAQESVEWSLRKQETFLVRASLSEVQQVQLQHLSSVVSFCDQTLILPLRASWEQSSCWLP